MPSLVTLYMIDANSTSQFKYYGLRFPAITLYGYFEIPRLYLLR